MINIMHRILSKLVTEYNDDPSADFVPHAIAAVKSYLPEREAKSTIDPDRLRTISSYLSKLKWQCYDLPIFNDDFEHDVKAIKASDPTNVAWRDWNECKTPADFIRLQRNWKAETGIKGKLAAVHVAPDFLRNLTLSKTEVDRAKEITKMQNRKQLDHAQDIDVDKLLEKVMPGLRAEKVTPVVVALLLATGRREVEILRTATFTKISAYRVTFSGHAKGRGASESYPIDLLAPADDVITALQWLRANLDVSKLTNSQINSKYSALINRAVARIAGLAKAHMLRGINAVACYKLWGGRKSIIGYIRGHLGHSTEGPSTMYSSWHVTITKPWGADTSWGSGTTESKDMKLELKSYSGPSATKAAQIVEMMKAGLLVTIKSVLKRYGGSPTLVAKVIEMNKGLIDDFNSGLEQ